MRLAACIRLLTTLCTRVEILQVLEPGIRSGLFTQYMKMLDNGLISSLSMTAESILACAFETTGDRKPELPMLATCLLRLLEIEVVNAASSEFAHVLWSSAESGV